MAASELEARLGRGIRSRRIAAKLSQGDLADRANLSLGAIQHLERGEGATTRTLTRALRALGAESWLDQLTPPPPSFNPLDLLKTRAHEARTPNAPRVRQRTDVAR